MLRPFYNLQHRRRRLVSNHRRHLQLEQVIQHLVEREQKDFVLNLMM
jgi:hypothetical protein